MIGDFDKVIGADDSCDIQMRRPGIASRHASIHRRGDRIFVDTIDEVGGVTLNGIPLEIASWREVTRKDTLRFGTLQIELGARLFEGRPRLDLSTERLWLSSKDGRDLCDGAWLRAAPGTFTAIMGPSGCGKSVLLSILSGQQKPERGSIMYREADFDPSTDGPGLELFDAAGQQIRCAKLGRSLKSDEAGSLIGFVPQADILIPELTVGQSLDHRLRLRYPAMGNSPRHQIMVRVAESLGFNGDRAKGFLATRIGHPEERGHVLSGGERRRANIAHELVLQPLVLFLDEPTSGLSSVDAEGVIEMLQRIAREERIVVVTTVHQPSREVFARFDRLLLLGFGGKLLYHGPVGSVSSHLQQALRISDSAQNPAEFVLRVQEVPSQVETLFRMSAKAPLPEYAPVEASHGSDTPTDIDTAKRRARRPQSGRPSWLLQWLLLCIRGLRVALSDRIGFLTSLGQIPAIALLLVLALSGGESLHRASDGIARFAHDFSVRNSKPDSSLGPLGPGEIKSIAAEAQKENGQVSEVRARQRAVSYFVLCLAAVWFGLVGAVREIVSEQALVSRECRSLVGPGSYLFAKFCVQGVITLVQVIVLVLLVTPAMPGLELTGVVPIIGLLWLGSLAAVSLGLLVSSSLPTYRAALGVVPLLVIPQVLFGGMLRPLVGEESQLARTLGAVTIQRWVFPAMLEQDRLASGGVLRVTLDDKRPMSSLLEAFGMLGSSEAKLPDLFFSPPPSWLGSHACAALLFLPVFSLALLFLARHLLIKRIITR